MKTMMKTPPISILVVDDDVDTCHNLSDILGDFGHQVDIAHSGPQALEKVRCKAYDIALLDFKMPDMDGLTLYREIRKLRADTVAMIISAYATPEQQQEALEAGMWRVLAKPVDFEELLALVDEAARQRLVMVVDDDHELCENLRELLTERGYRVALAHTEREAEEQLDVKQGIQVVLVDLKLPGGDGRHVLDYVRKSHPEARTVLITGHRSELEQLVQQAVTEGADAICYKPFDVPQLLETIDRFARSRDEA